MNIGREDVDTGRLILLRSSQARTLQPIRRGELACEVRLDPVSDS